MKIAIIAWTRNGNIKNFTNITAMTNNIINIVKNLEKIAKCNMIKFFLLDDLIAKILVLSAMSADTMKTTTVIQMTLWKKPQGQTFAKSAEQDMMMMMCGSPNTMMNVAIDVKNMNLRHAMKDKAANTATTTSNHDVKLVHLLQGERPSTTTTDAKLVKYVKAIETRTIHKIAPMMRACINHADLHMEGALQMQGALHLTQMQEGLWPMTKKLKIKNNLATTIKKNLMASTSSKCQGLRVRVIRKYTYLGNSRSTRYSA